RAAGAVIMGKTTLSEWAYWRGSPATSGWSGRGGQCNNPYIIDTSPLGSSSGSGAAVAANFTAGSLGTETDGSILGPANNNAVVGIKPTLGLTSRAGVVPISHNQDVVGPHGRTVSDAAVAPDIIAFGSEFVVLTYDFLRDLNAYLATRVGVPIRTLADAIAFNEANADEELQYFGQELFLLAQSDPFTQADYQAALADERMIGGPQGIDAALQQFGVDRKSTRLNS